LGKEWVWLCKEEFEAATRLSSQLEDNKKRDRKAIEVKDGEKEYERTKRTHL